MEYEGSGIHCPNGTALRRVARTLTAVPVVTARRVLGTALAQARAAELDCACQALGIQPPILLGLPDGGMGAETNKVALRESRAEIRIVCNPWRMRYGRFTFSDEAPGSRPY